METKVKVKSTMSLLSVGGVLISLSQPLSPYVDKPLKSVTHGQHDARPTVTFPAAEHHCPLAGTKLYCLITEAHVCENLPRVATWLGGVMVTASDLRSTGSRVRLPAVPLPSSNRGPVALCTLGLCLLNTPSLNGW